MPEFGTALTGMNSSRKLNHDELVRTIRFMISAEYEAVQIYQQVADSTDNKLAIRVIRDIIDEELKHAGEFLRLLRELEPNEMNLYQDGSKEVEEMMEKAASKT